MYVWVQLPCSLILSHFSPKPIHTSSSLYSCNVQENKRDHSVPQRAEIDVSFGEAKGCLLLLSVSAWKSPTGVNAFDTSKILALLEFCSLQAACSVGSWLPHCCLQHLKELRSQVFRSRQRVHYGSVEKRGLFCIIAGKLSCGLGDAGPLVPRAWIS